MLGENQAGKRIRIEIAQASRARSICLLARKQGGFDFYLSLNFQDKEKPLRSTPPATRSSTAIPLRRPLSTRVTRSASNAPVSTTNNKHSPESSNSAAKRTGGIKANDQWMIRIYRVTALEFIGAVRSNCSR